MKTKKSTRRLPEFQSGQIWQMGMDRVLIGLVGKTLVHYKHFRNANKRPPTLFTAKEELGRVLSTNKAILVQE